MKTILMLGGSAQQVVALETARRLGLRTVLCDYLPDNPGQFHADKFHCTSTTDREAVLAVARQEGIDGIIAYASDPAAPTAAYVAEKMGLPTNPCESVEILCNKDRFRRFLADNAFHTPRAIGFEDRTKALALSGELEWPVIVKPVDSSGSKGVTVLGERGGLEMAVDAAFSFSRAGRIVIEEFIEKRHPYLVGGDVFVSEGKVILWGLMNCHRDAALNPLVPVGKSYPAKLSPEDLTAVKETLQRLVDRLGIRFGPMNVELVIDRKGRVFPIDIGPRSGGNMIPDLLGMIFGVDVVEMSVRAAMGKPVTMEEREPRQWCATHNLHADWHGVLDRIEFSEEIERYIVRKCVYKEKGAEVHPFNHAAYALGIVFFMFPDGATMEKMLGAIPQHIRVLLLPPGKVGKGEKAGMRMQDRRVGG